MDIAESLSSVLNEQTNLCMSGGADGSDLQWGLQAGKLGHGVIHWSFDGHRTQAPEQEIVRLTEDQLAQANDALRRANKTIKRSWPSRSETTNNLLRRNWYQIKDTSSVYAISEIEDGKWTGGTAWAIQMYLDRFLHDNEPMNLCKIFVYEKNTRYWYTWENTHWVQMVSRPSTPSGIWTGIGSREISPICRIEIRKIMGTYEGADSMVNQLHPIIEDPKINDIIYVPDSKIPGQGANNRSGGWATIRRISTGVGDRKWIAVGEFSDNTEFEWSTIADQQIELRSKFKMSRAHNKPDLSPENNTKS
jgi:hypothetical protein